MLKDARNAQILFLSLFLLLGIGTRDWTLRPDFMLVIGCSCLLTQWFFSCLSSFYFSKKVTLLPPEFLAAWRSALITTLGLCLLLRANHWTTVALAGCCAIASKFIFQSQGKHFFNPANFGIIIALSLTSDAWVSPGQWGTDSWYFLVFLVTGGIILKKVGRWDTSLAFLVPYMGLEAWRNFSLGWSWDVYSHQLMSGSLLLFAFFMITDPRSIPNATLSRILWAVLIAGLTFILQHQFFISTALFWALFSLSPLTIVFDQLFHASRFYWSEKYLKSLLSSPVL
jgi:Na+-transporting NADH:ubiquinone oxidoreductase subunit NqrB